MSNQTPDYLKLHVVTGDQANLAEADASPQIQSLCSSFEAVTGRPLRYEEGQSCGGFDHWSEQQRGRIVVDDRASPSRDVAVALQQGVDQLAGAINDLVEELQAAKKALWQREAELAAGVPVVRHAEEEAHLALRLETVMRGGAEAIDCQAVALYMLDETTANLKMRASWGLPHQRLVDSSRPLKGAAADLEALVGHAVVLKDTSVLEHFKSPEEYPAAVCVPVSTPTTVLGTLWFFSDVARDFPVQQTTVAEIVAGRVASDLEREMLLQQSVTNKKWEREFSQLADRQQRRLPNVAPVVKDWQVASWYDPADESSGEFYDWFSLPDGRMGVAIGQAGGVALESVLTTVAVQTAIRSHSTYPHTCGEMLGRISETLWLTSPGDQFASLFYTLLDTENGGVELSAAGRVGGVICRQDSSEILTVASSQLGSDVDVAIQSFNASVQRGDTLVMFTSGVRAALEKLDDTSAESTIAAVLTGYEDAPAEAVTERIRDLVKTYNPARALADRTVLVVKRN